MVHQLHYFNTVFNLPSPHDNEVSGPISPAAVPGATGGHGVKVGTILRLSYPSLCDLLTGPTYQAGATYAGLIMWVVKN